MRLSFRSCDPPRESVRRKRTEGGAVNGRSSRLLRESDRCNWKCARSVLSCEICVSQSKPCGDKNLHPRMSLNVSGVFPETTMPTTIDITDEEADCMRRALAVLINNHTMSLRALGDEHDPARVVRMFEDIRTAASLAGRLPFSRFARSAQNDCTISPTTGINR
jgi:hypothetical protein